MKRPPESSSRSSASSATTIGLRVKARAIPVARPMRSVAAGGDRERDGGGAVQLGRPQPRQPGALGLGREPRDLGRVVLAEQLAVNRDRERGRHVCEYPSP